MLTTIAIVLALALATFSAVQAFRILTRIQRADAAEATRAADLKKFDELLGVRKPQRTTQPIASGTLTKRVEPDPEVTHSNELTARPKPRQLPRFRLDSTIGREAYVVVDTQREAEVCSASNFTDGQHATEALNFHYKWANLPEPFVSIARGTEVRQTLIQARVVLNLVARSDWATQPLIDPDLPRLIEALNVILDSHELLKAVS